MNREAIWLHGYRTTTPYYYMFQRLNLARRRAQAVAGYRARMAWYKCDAHTAMIAKPPMVSVLTNHGASAPPRVYYLSPASTTYGANMPVIDVLTGQIFATDPAGGLAVTIISGEPRVFLPLPVFEGRKQPVWQHVGPRVVRRKSSLTRASIRWLWPRSSM